MTINFHNTHFEISASRMVECPGASVPEIVFAGRSNAGKSTATYQLVRQGWSFVSDDALLLRATGAEVTAFVLRRPFGLDADAAEDIAQETFVRLLRQKLDGLLAEVDAVVPEYAQARTAYAGESKLLEAVEIAAQHLDSCPPQVPHRGARHEQRIFVHLLGLEVLLMPRERFCSTRKRARDGRQVHLLRAGGERLEHLDGGPEVLRDLGLEMIMEGWGFEFPFNHRSLFTTEWEELWMRYLIARYDGVGWSGLGSGIDVSRTGVYAVEPIPGAAVFFALPGAKTDGNRHLKDALAQARRDGRQG